MRVIVALVDTGLSLFHPSSTPNIGLAEPAKLLTYAVYRMLPRMNFRIAFRWMPFGNLNNLEVSKARQRPYIIFTVDVAMVFAP
jgi:hypothetical protein